MPDRTPRRSVKCRPTHNTIRIGPARYRRSAQIPFLLLRFAPAFAECALVHNVRLGRRDVAEGNRAYAARPMTFLGQQAPREPARIASEGHSHQENALHEEPAKHPGSKTSRAPSCPDQKADAVLADRHFLLRGECSGLPRDPSSRAPPGPVARPMPSTHV